jgi:hypothetical protein
VGALAAAPRGGVGAGRPLGPGEGLALVGEMEEIAATFAAAGLPSGFHEAAAEIFAREG